MTSTSPGEVQEGINILPQRFLHIHVHCCSIYNIQQMKTSLIFSNWLMNNENALYIQTRILFISNNTGIINFEGNNMPIRN